jgi:hypothetical protein
MGCLAFGCNSFGFAKAFFGVVYKEQFSSGYNMI